MTVTRENGIPPRPPFTTSRAVPRGAARQEAAAESTSTRARRNVSSTQVAQGSRRRGRWRGGVEVRRVRAAATPCASVVAQAGLLVSRLAVALQSNGNHTGGGERPVLTGPALRRQERDRRGRSGRRDRRSRRGPRSPAPRRRALADRRDRGPGKGRNVMSQQASLGVAVIGTGKMGADHVRRINEVISGARVAAVVDVDAGRVPRRSPPASKAARPTPTPPRPWPRPASTPSSIASPGPRPRGGAAHRLRARPAGAVREAAHPGRRPPRCGCWRRSSGWATAGSRSGSCGATTPSTSSSRRCWTAASWAGR